MNYNTFVWPSQVLFTHKENRSPKPHRRLMHSLASIVLEPLTSHRPVFFTMPCEFRGINPKRPEYVPAPPPEARTNPKSSYRSRAKKRKD